jgi:hypothetical protein
VEASLSKRQPVTGSPSMMAPSIVEGPSIARADGVSVKDVPSTLRPGICYSIQLDTCIHRLDADSIYIPEFYGIDQISESLRVGDELIGSDGRSRVSRDKGRNKRLGKKKSTDVHVEVVAALRDLT